MSFRSLLNHTLSRYRSTESKGTNESVVRTWAPGGGFSSGFDLGFTSSLAGAVQVKGESWSDDGGGERVIGKYLVFLLAGADVLEGDILAVTAGPDAANFGFLWVDGVSQPRGHHTEVEAHATKEDPTT